MPTFYSANMTICEFLTHKACIFFIGCDAGEFIHIFMLQTVYHVSETVGDSQS